MRTRTVVRLLALPFMLSVIVPCVAQGQVLISLLLGDKVSSEKFHLGIEAGLNVSDLSGIDGAKARTGLFLGIIGEWRFASRWFLQPELVPFYYAGAGNLPPSAFPPPPEVEDIVSGDDVSRRLKYFAIPILLKFGVADNRLHIGAGPQVGFLTSATDTYEGTSSNGNSVTVNQDAKDITASTDAGILLNLEWKVRRGFSPGLVARYYFGLTDTLVDNPGDAVYNRVFSILLTIPIGGDPSEIKEDED